MLKIPDELDLAGAAPLLCAGITTYSPLRHWNVGAGSKVAVVGLGGLGHMGLKLAKAMGAEVTLFSRSPGKEADARRLGADHIVISTDAAQMAAVAGRFDLIIDTVPYVHDVNPYVPTLAVGGTIVMVGYLGPLDAFNTGPLVFSRKAPGRLADRRHRRDPGDAGLLRPARHHLRHRDDPYPGHQRSLRAPAQGGREVPLRDRHGVAEEEVAA